MPWPFPQLADLARVVRGDRLFSRPAVDWRAFVYVAGAAPSCPADDLARSALEAAVELIGQGEVGGDNRGPFVEMLLEPAKAPANWCAAFAGFCYQRAAARLNMDLPFQRSLGAKRLGRNVGAVGRIFQDPTQAKPGDLMVFHRGAKGSWMGHVGIIEALSDVNVHTVEGNSGPKVMRRVRRVGLDRFAFFASLRRA